MNLDSIPHDLKQYPYWCVWKYEQRQGEGKPTKLPYHPLTAQLAKSNDSGTFTPFDIASKALNGEAGYSGMGVGLFGNIAAIDIDNCIDTAGQPNELARDVMSTMNTYAEISPSGSGLRLFFLAPDFNYDKARYYIKNSGAGLEVYVAGNTSRFVTVTGNAYGFPMPIADCSDKLPQVLDKYMRRPEREHTASAVEPPGSMLTDEEIKAKAPNAKNGALFTRLWNGDTSAHNGDDSAADQALCNLLAFWTGGDMEQMDRLFRESSLYRDKWEREDYSSATLEKAVRDCVIFYNPGSTAAEDFAGLGSNTKSIKPEDFTDTGNAVIFARVFHGSVAYCTATGWLVWDGSRWEESELAAQNQAMRLTNAMLAEAAALLGAARAELTSAETDVDTDRISSANTRVTQAKAYHKHALATRNKPKIQALLSLARSYLEVKSDALDADPYILNTPAGMVDLRTGGILPHDPAKFCTKITAVSPSDENAHKWTELINTVTEQDAGLIAYLQHTAGMSAVGKVFEESLIIALGDGSNGKSTVFNPLAAVMGDYAGTIDADLLTTAKQNKGAELATLKGKRLIIAAELEEGRRLSTGALKRIASTDTIRAERKYLAPEDFCPTHTMVLYTNHAPRVGSTDTGTWRRLAVIPFTAKIPKTAEVKNYASVLVQEAGGAILSWIIQGAIAFCRAGHKLPHCDRVEAARERYKQDNDWMSRFLEECCEVEQGKSVASGLLYSRYRQWAIDSTEYVRSTTDFTAELVKREFEKRPTKAGKFWFGLCFATSTINAFPVTNDG